MPVSQTRLLARTFFGRLFESELMPQGLPQMQLLLWGLVFAGGPTFGFPLLLTKKYNRLYSEGGLALAIPTDRAILLTLSMLSIGFVGLLIWDGIYPDRRDVRILGPLPVRTRTFVAARLLAVGQVFLLFAIAICVPQAIVFGLLAGSFGDPAGLILGPIAHLLTAAAACTLVFSALLAMQCLLLLVLGRRAAQRASVVLQVVFAIALVQLLFFLPQLGELLRNRERMLMTGTAALVPGVWFLGLYEWLAGFAGPVATQLARAAAASAFGSLLLSTALYALSYQRLSRLALEGVATVPTVGRRRAQPADTAAASDAMRRAIQEFVVRTIVRTRQHRMILALYMGIGLAFVLSTLVALAMRRGGPALAKPSVALLSIPLVLQFFPLVAMRVLAAIPAEPKANWVFRAGEPADRAHAIDGFRDAMIRTVIAPTTALAGAMAWVLWGPLVALCHAIFCWAAAHLLVEILLVTLRKIPFTCTYLPGRARVRTLWPFYLMSFTAYCYTLAGIELALLPTPVRMLGVCAAMLVAGHVALRLRHSALAAAPGLRFVEEDPEAMFEGFRLSEGLASTVRTPLQ